MIRFECGGGVQRSRGLADDERECAGRLREGVDWGEKERSAGDVRGGDDDDGGGGTREKIEKQTFFPAIKVRAHTPLFGIVEKNRSICDCNSYALVTSV